MQANVITPLSEHDPHDPESMAQLAQVLAHRLRGLVASIEGFTDLLTDTLVTRDQRELALKIMEGTSRIESVLADLQLYGESLEPVMLPVRVEEVLARLLTPLPESEQDRIKKFVDTGIGSRMLDADPFLVRQALLILTQNALDATRRGGAVELHVGLADDEERIEFSLWNDGVIGVEHAERLVFAPFYTTKAHNLGVGLTIARRIAKLHGGSLELTGNSIEDGVQFSLFLPING